MSSAAHDVSVTQGALTPWVFFAMSGKIVARSAGFVPVCSAVFLKMANQEI